MPDNNPLFLVDTNVWLDYYLPDRRNQKAAKDFLSSAYAKEASLLYPAAILKDVFYVAYTTMKHDIYCDEFSTQGSSKSALAAESAWSCVYSIQEHAFAVGSDLSDVWMACKLRSFHNDLEDNFVIAAAMRANATCLVTNDEKLIKHSPVLALTPENALKLLEEQLA